MFKPPELNEAAFAYYPRLRRLKQFIEENYNRPISLENAADEVGLERTYFSTFFRQKTGVRFWQWLAYVRIQRAADLLRAEDLAITRLAQIVGYEDLRTFERAFKKVTGMTPSTFKKTVRPTEFQPVPTPQDPGRISP